MRQIKSTGMKPEMTVRRLVHGMGYRYRLHRKDLPGKPDMVFAGRRKVIFVHGCFWHQHSDPACKITRMPKSRKDYWINKLRRNTERDHDHQQKLQKMEWDVMIIWECQTKNTDALIPLIRDFLEDE